jgi:serine/threonine protein kinase
MASELIPVTRDFDLDVTIRGLNASQLVFGRYNLRRILGRGGMGIVWLAQDEQLDREVALKFLPEDVFFDAAALDELKRETKRCLDLTHPNIIRIYDFIKDEQAAAISMEYIDGKTLAELRVEKPSRVFEVEEMRGWIGPVCQGLHYAHAEAGVVHRDLKPANLMLTSRNQVKIADFGISQSMSDSMSRRTIRHGTSSGTLAYMSPQQLNGEVARPTDDIYALGATLYELLTGKPPFHSGDVLFQIRLNMPKSMAERRADFEIAGEPIPAEWEETVEACLSKIPSERPATMAEIAERLGGMRRNSSSVVSLAPEVDRPRRAPVSAPAVPPALPPQPNDRKSPAIPIAAAAALMLIVAGAGYSHFKSPAAPRNGATVSPAPVVIAPMLPATVAPIDPAPVVVDTSGSLVVDSNPPGATVHIEGLPAQATPADFAKLRAGSYHVLISASGYETEQSTVTVTSNAKTDMGALQLRRATGDLSVAAVPPRSHYRVAGLGTTASIQREGTVPDILLGLPTGDYQVTLTSTGLPPATSGVVIAAHQKAAVQTDLVDRAVTRNATTPVVAVFHGSAAASSLDEAEKNALIALINQAFQMYLNAGLLDQASAQLDVLRNLQQDTAPQQTALVAKSSTVEQAFATEIQQLVTTRKLATAEERLRQLQGTLDADAVNRIEAPYRNQFAQYRAQMDSAIEASKVQAPETADEPLRLLGKQYPDNLSLLLARAQVQTRMPPGADTLAVQLKEFQKFGIQNKAFAADPALIAMEQDFADEQRQLEIAMEDLKAAKKGPATLRSEIDELEERKTVYRHRQVGAPQGNPFSTAINFFGKAVTGHRVVDRTAYFESSAAKREAIADLQARIDRDKAALALPPTSLQDAQNRYDQFIAHVPWGASPAPATASSIPTAASPTGLP